MATNIEDAKVSVGLFSVEICQIFQRLMHFLFYGHIIKYSLVLLLLGQAQCTKQMLNYDFKIFKQTQHKSLQIYQFVPLIFFPPDIECFENQKKKNIKTFEMKTPFMRIKKKKSQKTCQCVNQVILKRHVPLCCIKCGNSQLETIIIKKEICKNRRRSPCSAVFNSKVSRTKHLKF